MGTSSHPEKHVSEFSWEGFESVSKGAYRNVLPDSLKSLVEAGKQDTVNGLIMFSDPEPYEFLEALDRNFENAFKVWLVIIIIWYLNYFTNSILITVRSHIGFYAIHNGHPTHHVPQQRHPHIRRNRYRALQLPTI